MIHRPLAVLRLILPLLLALPCARAAAQTPAAPADSARDLVERFLAPDGWPGRARFYTGEMVQAADSATLGRAIPATADIVYRTLRSSPTQRVIAATISAEGHSEDWYFYLSRLQDGWKLAAVRALALPPLYYMAIDSLSAQRSLPDSLRINLAEMRLASSPDAALKTHLTGNAAAFATLARAAGRLGVGQFVRSNGTAGGGYRIPAGLVASMRALHVSVVHGDPARPACLFLTVGGILDNEVGYLYAPPGCTVPELSPQRYIMVEPISPGWYLYKTT